MATNIRRSRSNTSMSNRPLSRASTASVHSFDQHDLQPQFHSQQQQAQPSDYPHTQYNPAALLHAAQHVSQQDGMNMDQMNQLLGFNAGAGPNSLPTHATNAAHAFHSSLPPQQPQPPQQQQFVAAPVEVEEKKKKGSASGSATNDKELREMLARNEGRNLKDVAGEVLATDRTSKAEKTKQLFAMLWLKSVCRTAKTSVPRNRVYSKYAERCGTERVIPLNPASFGKLVRVIFPGIQTRRLGVRGESKYHYVDLALINDSDDADDGRRPGTASASHNGLKRHNSTGPKLDFNSMPRLPADTAAFPPQETFESNSSYFSQGSSSQGRLFTNIFSQEFRPTNCRTSAMYDYELKFPSLELLSTPDDLDIALPDIARYLPARTDPDAAEALVALYRTHCTSLIDSVRYCKEKQFFRLFGSFHGTLTLPVQKLFATPEIASWVRECDWMMYQKMIRNVSQLTLQVAPPPVLKFLDNVAKQLHPHILKVFQALPTHVLEAKLEPATLFAHLLRQMLRVNQAAHAAAVMLTADENRDRMWEDWKAYVYPKRVVENELPHSCSHEDVYNILMTEIRAMLIPLKSETFLPDGTFYQVSTPDPPIDPTQETVIDRIAAFLTRLPSRFPRASARTILHCVNAIGSACLREITVENGQSFQGWWLTKVFIDEMGQWLASLGGFLDHTPPNWNSLTYSPELMGESMNAGMTNGGSNSNNDSRYSSIDADFGPNQSFVATNDTTQGTGNASHESNARRHPEQFDQVSFGMDFDFSTSQPQQEQNLDDSGIGLLEDGIDAKFASTLKSHLTQLPSGVS